MKLTYADIPIQSLVLSEEQLATRTPGCHVSSILRHIEVVSGMRKDNNFSEADLDRFAMLGRLFESLMAQSLFQPPRYIRLGELECDGIIGSPDCFDQEKDAVGEFKATWRWVPRDIRDFYKYWWQVKAYAHMLGTLEAFLVVLYVSGEGRPPVPKIVRYDATFTKPELVANWAMLMENKEAACV
jgi:hypothetical protein